MSRLTKYVLAGILTMGLVGGLATLPATGAGPATHLRSAAVPDSFTITGSGFGHGVGMSQYGAYELARGGASAVEILDHYYTDTSARFRDTRSRVAVQVFGPDPYRFSGYGDKVQQTTLRIDNGRWRVRGPKGNVRIQGIGGRELTMSTSGGRVTITFRGTQYRAKTFRLEWAGTRHYKPDGQLARVTVDGAHGRYRHGHLMMMSKGGDANIVNVLRLNTEYLYGIAEMPSSWGLNGGERALRAQAITARSYALTKTKKFACGCHVVDDVRDQNFTGWTKESEGPGGRYGAVWTSAVDATKNLATRARVLTSGGRPVAAHYFAASGGRTANSEDVWSSVVSYERSVDDPYSLAAPGNSYVSWTRELTQKNAQRLFGLSDVAKIRVTSRYSSGQTRTITGWSEAGERSSVSGSADEIRSTVGAQTSASLPASWISKTTNN